QRLGFCLGADEFQRGRCCDHACNAAVVAGGPCVSCHAFLDVLGLADVEDIASCIDHSVYASGGRCQLGKARNRCPPGGERPGSTFNIEVWQRWLLVLLAQLTCRIDVFVGAVHRRKIVRGLRYSTISLSAVRQDKCCPPSTGKVTPVTLLACAR